MCELTRTLRTTLMTAALAAGACLAAPTARGTILIPKSSSSEETQ
jgi:hypothetical protein